MSTASDLAAHVANTANPHKTVKAQVGLGNVTNTSDAAKPVSTAQRAAITEATATALQAVADETSRARAAEESLRAAAYQATDTATPAGTPIKLGAQTTNLTATWTASTTDVTAMQVTPLVASAAYADDANVVASWATPAAGTPADYTVASYRPIAAALPALLSAIR